MTSKYLSDKQCFVIITALRKYINQCNLKASDIDSIVKETSILESLRLFFAIEQDNIFRTQIKLEATWITLNLAMGSVQTIEMICSEEFRLFQSIDKQLDQSSEEIMLHSVWFMGNILVES